MHGHDMRLGGRAWELGARLGIPPNACRSQLTMVVSLQRSFRVNVLARIAHGVIGSIGPDSV